MTARQVESSELHGTLVSLPRTAFPDASSTPFRSPQYEPPLPSGLGPQGDLDDVRGYTPPARPEPKTNGVGC